MDAREIQKIPLANMRASPSFLESRGAVILAGGIIAVAGFAAYANSFSGSFVFLDGAAILQNPTIRHLWPPGRILSPPADGSLTVGGRPVLNLSLAVNYAISGARVWSYHALNVLIHVLAGLTLFGIARRTLGKALAGRSHPPVNTLALAIALLWTLHPLHTESVTYIVQRAESLMGLFYLLTVYCFIRGAERRSPARSRAWLALSVAACLFGMGTKEVMVSAPVMVLLYDRTFLSGAFGEAWRRRWGYYLALASTWLPLAWLVAGAGGSRGGTSGFALGISWWTYARTQFPAVVHYLRLSVWPHPLIFYYAVEWSRPFAAILPDAIIVAVLAGATMGAVFSRRFEPRAFGFLGAWFFAILAPTSLVPGLSQTIAEHRTYLALVPVIAAAVLAAYAWLGRRSLILFFAAAAGLGCLTARRSGTYRSDVDLWSDTAAKAPSNPHSQNNLGVALASAGRAPEAIARFDRALQLDPRYPEAHNNLGLALANAGRMDEAISHFEEALRLKRVYPEADTNLGVALAGQGRFAAAIVHFRHALAAQPDYADALNDLAVALARTGRFDEAIVQYRKAVGLMPENAEARFNLGNALVHAGRRDEAIAEYEEASRLKPEDPEIHANLGAILAESNRLPEAIGQYEQALKLHPDDGDVHYNLGLALQGEGRMEDARRQFAEAARLGTKP
jgi:Flp pilus assembly protein TadD